MAMACRLGMRMPIAPASLAALYLPFQGHKLLAAECKAVLFLLPTLGAFVLAWRYAKGSKSMHALKAALGLFAAALLLPPTLLSIDLRSYYMPLPTNMSR